MYDWIMSSRPYQKLIVWQEADALCLFTYKTTKSFPTEEKFALVQQMRRSAYGIPMCIVEGNMRKTSKDKKNFFTISLASLEELHYQYSLALRLQYLDKSIFDKADDKIMRISYLLRKLHDSI